MSSYGSGPSFWRNLIRLIRRDDPHADLGSILQLASSTAPIEERILWFAQLVAWLRGPVVEDNNPVASTLEAKSRASIARVRFLLRVLDRHPDHFNNVSGVLRSILLETDSTTLVTRTGLTEHSGFFTDLMRRLTNQIIPPAPRPHELGYVIDVVFAEDRDTAWLEQLSDEEWNSLLELVLNPRSEVADPRPKLAMELGEAVLQICIQVAALGLHADLRERAAQTTTKVSPFVGLTRAALAAPSATGRVELLDRVHQCQSTLRHVQKTIEERGVSLSLLYRIETLNSLLRRLIELSLVLNPEASLNEKRLSVRELSSEILRSHRERSSVSGLLSMNFDLFAKKLVEHAGETGEHYITRNEREYNEMWWSAAGGGMITVATTLMKFTIFGLHAPLGLEGLLIWFNYSGSFLTMQYFDFSLATKQPSMTAAALAGRIEKFMPDPAKNRFIDEVVHIIRSQLVAAAGNVSIVAIGSLFVGTFYYRLFHRPILDEHHAIQTMKDLNPLTSFTILYATITGVLLWLSSLCAGWLQNWVNMRGLTRALGGQPRLVAIFGSRRATEFGLWVQRNCAGIGANVSIGFFLALIPLCGKVTGLPLDVRHITLSSGSVTFAMLSLGQRSLNWHLWLPTLIGLICTLILNFAVSFSLALIVATRSRRMPLSWLRSILGDIGLRFRESPLEFFVPRKRAEPVLPVNKRQPTHPNQIKDIDNDAKNPHK